MRLDKFIAQQLGVSRAIAGREIRASRVTVDGDIVKDSAFKLQPEHQVEYDGNPLTQQNGPRYFMLNKPEGYVCSTDDPDHPTVLYDGQWSHRITSPRHHCEKTYRVMLESPVSDDTAEQFAKGVQLHNEKDLTKPAVLEILTPTDVRLTISEGRYHQVKRMFAAVGNHVVGLHRERIGAIELDPDLAPGEYRPLTEEEIASVGLPSR
ncbi:MAG: pseudouridine synthase [Enterobacter hormaechei]|nr:pseudouridine synthase [Enterobacter hormaechei]